MKKLILSLSIIAAAFTLISCSKDKGQGGTPGYHGQNGVYGTTPNDRSCGNGYVGYPYQGYRQQGGYYGQQYGQQQYRPNCIPQTHVYGGNPYVFQIQYQMYIGTCDTRFAGRAQLCPPGYSCRTSYGPIGVCLRY